MENISESVPTTEMNEKRRVLVGIAVFSVVSTIASVLAEPNQSVYSAISILTAVGFGVGILIWCKADSQERNIPLSSGFRIAVVIFGLFALIYYLFKSRGFKRGFVSTGYALLFGLILFMINVIVGTCMTLISMMIFGMP